jgi:hypothetical protein
MKRRLSLLLITLLILPILFTSSANGLVEIFGGGGGANYSKYSQTIVIQPSSTQVSTVTDTGSTWQNLPWLEPYYISVVNSNELQIVLSSYNSGSYGGFAVGYGVNYPPQILNGNYEPAKPYGNADIVVVLERDNRR